MQTKNTPDIGSVFQYTVCGKSQILAKIVTFIFQNICFIDFLTALFYIISFFRIHYHFSSYLFDPNKAGTSSY